MNVQGDEPLDARRRSSARSRGCSQAHADADIGTLAAPIETLSEFLDPNAVKVVTDAPAGALVLQPRADPVECAMARRRASPASAISPARGATSACMPTACAALLRLAQLPAGALEGARETRAAARARAWLGIRVGEALERPGPDVNTLADLERVSALMARAGS